MFYIILIARANIFFHWIYGKVSSLFVQSSSVVFSPLWIFTIRHIVAAVAVATILRHFFSRGKMQMRQIYELKNSYVM